MTGPVGHHHHHRRPAGAVTGRGQQGVVGGVEVLPFGLLIFVAVMLLVANVWAVIDAKLTVDAAAREAGRAYVEAPNRVEARRAARSAAADTVAGAGRDPDRLTVTDNNPRYRRCEVVEHETGYTVPALSIPFIGGFGRGITVHGHHREVLDPFRAGLGSDHDDCG